MNSYSPAPFHYPSSPSAHGMYANYATPPPSSSYCSCCCYSSMPLYHPGITPTYTISPSTITPYHHQVPTPTTTPRVARLQYTNKHRYVLNELFKRTPYPNGIQRDLIARQLGITQEQIRIWFQNRRRLQTQRDSGERPATANEHSSLEQGRTAVNVHELKQLIKDVAQYKDAPPRLRLDDSS